MNYELRTERSAKIQTFTDLNAWKEAYKLTLMIYEITKRFPKEELFGLVSQMRRCSVSITSNIAEGFSRQSYGEKVQFYSIAQGSVTELQNQLLVAQGVSVLDEKDFCRYFSSQPKCIKF
ncbi:MAG: four helix bundle protein [Candidatus Taylorbacteria bacterium]|nr:four helix bundle protein [Candidatus Taylorbacteria bacterium]